MENSEIKQQFSRYLFWDVGEMDWEVHRNFIVARVMDRGTRGDVRRVWGHYGAEEEPNPNDLKGRTWDEVKKTVLESNRL